MTSKLGVIKTGRRGGRSEAQIARLCFQVLISTTAMGGELSAWRKQGREAWLY